MENNQPLLKLVLWLLRGFWKKRILLLSIDIFAILSSFFLSYLFSKFCLSVSARLSDYVLMIFLFAIFLLLSLYFLNGYKSMENRRPEKELEISVKAVCFAFLVSFLVTFITFKELLSRYIIIFWWLIAIVLLSSFRLSLREVYKYLWKRGYLRQNVIVIGKPELANIIKERFAIQRHFRFQFIGAVVKDPLFLINPACGLRILGRLDELEDILGKYNIQRAFIIPFEIPFEKVSEIMRLCRNRNLTINILSEDFSLLNQKIFFDEYTGLLTIEASNIGPFSRKLNQLIKRTVDIIGSLVGILALGFVYPLLATIIKLEDGGPVIYRRRMLGKGKFEFEIFKFRSMKIDADEILNNNPQLKKAFLRNYKLREDPRCTRVGRFIRKYSLDELPQFINVLIGQMSLVGPRPIVKSEVKKYRRWKNKLFSVKPGLTGFWQVGGRQITNYEERVKMDMFYIDQWSIWMDIIIILKTIWKVVIREGAY